MGKAPGATGGAERSGDDKGPRPEILAHALDGRCFNAARAELFLDDGKVLIDQTSTPGTQTAPAVDSVLAAVANLSFTKLAARDLKVVAKREGAEAFLVGRLTCEIVKSPAQVQAKGTFERSGITLPFDFTLNTQTAAAGRLPRAVWPPQP